MSNYGLVVNNANGGLMFDSQRKMNSYVVTEIGYSSTSPSTTIANDDFVFVKVPSGQAANFANTVIFLSPLGSFYGRVKTDPNVPGDPTTFSSASLVNLDYFVVKHSSKVTSTENYGLVIYNEDGTVQFDSRSITLGNHFLITGYNETRSVDAWSAIDGGASLGDINDYWEISRWTSGTLATFGQETAIVGIWFNNVPYAINYFSSVGGQYGENNNNNTNFTEQWGSTISNMILSAELT